MSFQLHWGIKKSIKLLYEIFLIVIENILIYPLSRKLQKYLISRIIFHYGADYRWNDEGSHNINKKQGGLGFGLIHYSIVRSQRPSRILCIGSMYGFIPFMLTRACQDNDYGHVDFVDAGYGIKSKNPRINKSFWKKADFNKHFSFLSDPSRITFHKITSEEYLKTSTKKKWDYIYIDGDHSYKGVKKDFELYFPHLIKKGYMIIHDINKKSSYEKKYGVNRFWREIKEKNIYSLIDFDGECGLGILKK